MNREWHAEHPMPPRATPEQRLDWHRAHAAACGCRRPPADVAARLAEEAEAPAAQRRSDGCGTPA